ncbi:MAG: M48 family metallopeptidase [Erysipelotrichaceae bacterium]|nr:M48 family metallopeptidase [Erysipelotrichaceae bacterium]
MPIDKNVFLHETDKTALKALESLPGFSSVVKAFMSGWNEKLMYIENMATNVRISDDQLKRYKDMLGPICTKLGIEEPELFLRLDVRPNAWTYGEKKPYIVITSGLLETLPEELIPTVLAHECGHIACHHVLYRTMGTMILNGLFTAFPLTAVAVLPLKAAFAYWMRCSEYSADRAAILCDGTDEKLVQMCMRFAGFTRDVEGEMNLDAFMKQAEEYRELIQSDKVNKAMEFMKYSFSDHPLNAVRAYEARSWRNTEAFEKSQRYFEAYQRGEAPEEFPLDVDVHSLIGRDVKEAEESFRKKGFRNISLERDTARSLFGRNDTVTKITVGSNSDAQEGDWVNYDTPIILRYYLPYSDEEVRAMHPGEIRMPYSSNFFTGKKKDDVCAYLEKMGFDYVTTEAVYDVPAEGNWSLGRVIRLEGDVPSFERGDWLKADTFFKVVYHERKELN